MKTLHLSDTLSLPVKAVTEKMAWLGVTGSGKTYGGMKMAELMLEAGAQIVAIDPVGVWRGLRMGGSFNVYIFGGLSADYPLEPGSGVLIADLIVDKNISAVLDISQFEYDTDRNRFLTAFADRFYFRKKTSRSAVHVFMEECHEYIPQNLQRGEEKTLHAFQRMVKLGRFAGIGASLISQRPQEVNKKALNQAQTIFCFQLTGPQERKAVQEWISDKGLSGAELNDLLPKIKVGQPHVWSPTFLKVSETIKIRKKLTSDISSTPEVGETAVVGKLTKIDGEKLRAEMAASIEKAKADDPDFLKSEVARLSKELKKAGERQAHPVHVVSPPQIVEVLVLSDREREKIKLFVDTFGKLTPQVTEIVSLLKLVDANQAKQRITKFTIKGPPPPEMKNVVLAKGEPNFPSYSGALMSTKIGGGLKRMMVAMSQRPGLTRRQLGIRATLSSKSGTFDTYLSTLRKNGWITSDNGEFRLTSVGSAMLGSYQPLPEGRELLEYWLNDLGTSGANRILRALADCYPAALSREELGQAANISHTSGTFDTYLSKLRTLELITGKGELKASEELFD